MENELFHRAKSAFLNLSTTGVHVPEKDIEAIKQVIKEAYDHSSPEEKEELERMEKLLKNDGHLH